MVNNDVIDWLLKGDASIRYQTYRDLLSKDKRDIRDKISKQGWGKRFLSLRGQNGHWGSGFYQPKWTSTHYTLLDLRNLCISPIQPEIRKTINMAADTEKGIDGGINPARTIGKSDVCINGMFLNYAAYFQVEEAKLESIIDFIILQRMPDGGFNCQYNRKGAVHSSLHSTLSVIEGITEFENNGYTYRLNELKSAEATSKEFILKHQLFLSDRTGKVINKSFLNIPYPCRWKYDILRALDYFRYSDTEWDERMLPAIQVLLKKQTKNRTWKLQAKHPGKQHFEMEKAGKPSRWNTLRALRVLKKYGSVKK